VARSARSDRLEGELTVDKENRTISWAITDDKGDVSKVIEAFVNKRCIAIKMVPLSGRFIWDAMLKWIDTQRFVGQSWISNAPLDENYAEWITNDGLLGASIRKSDGSVQVASIEFLKAKGKFVSNPDYGLPQSRTMLIAPKKPTYNKTKKQSPPLGGLCS
jgi:hypothetical protein